MSVFDDDEDEDEGNSSLAVGRALAAGEEADVPEETPTVLAVPPQSDFASYQDDGSAEQLAAADDGYENEQEGGAQPSSNAQVPTQGGSSPAADTGDDMAMQLQTPIKAPAAPALKPYSNAPQEAAEQLAQAKASFNPADYKPSGWRRAGAALAGAATAAGFRNPSMGEQIGMGALNAPLDRARAVEAQKEAGLQGQIQAGNDQNAATQRDNEGMLQEYNLEERGMRNQGYAADQNATAADRWAKAQAERNAITQFTPSDPNNPYAGGTGKTADGRTMPNVPPPDKWVQSWVKTPQGQAATQRMAAQQRTQVAEQAGLKGDERSEFIATGKVSHATRVSVPSEAQERYNDWKTQFQKDNNRTPNAAEINAYSHVQRGNLSQSLSDKIDLQKQNEIATAKTQFDTDMKNAGKDPDKIKAAKGDYLDAWQAAQDKFEERIENGTGEPVEHVVIRDNVDPNTLEWHGKAPAQQQSQSQRPAAPAQQAQPNTFQYNGQTYTVGQKVNVTGKGSFTVSGFNPKSGRPILAAAQ